MSRSVGWIALAQIFAVVVAFIAVGAVLKFSGYPSSEFVRWNPVAVAFREHGPWLLLFPLIWAIYALACVQYNRGFFSETLAVILGMLFVFVVLILFFYAICTPFTRPMLRHVQPSASPTTNEMKGQK